MIIKSLQKEYLDLLKTYEQDIFSEEVDQNKVVRLLDEIQNFWFSKREIIEYELEKLTTTKKTFVLFGAIYLDVKDSEHYLFKALGDEHIISDPLLRLENFFRVSGNFFDQKSIELLQRAFVDVLEILSKYNNHFYILPIHLVAVDNQKEHMETLEKFFLNFLNSVLNEKFKLIDEFYEKYSTYQDIETNMSSFFKDNLKFNDFNLNENSLREKVENHIKLQSALSTILADRSEAEKFIITLQSMVMQIAEVLSIAVLTNTIPFIRYRPTFNYLLIVMYTFLEDELLKEKIEKTIIFYIFYYTVDKYELEKNDFDEYVKKLKKNDFLTLIIDKIRKEKIDIFNSRFDKVRNIINRVFISQFCE